MPIRRPLLNLDNPQLQKALRLSEQRNPHAAIRGMGAEGVYRGFAARDRQRELHSEAFASQHAMRQQRLSDRVRQHSAMADITQRGLREAKRGGNIAKVLGLGQLGLGYAGVQDAKKARKEQRQWQAMIMRNYISRATPEGLASLHNLFPGGRIGGAIRKTPWWRIQTGAGGL